MTVVTTERLRHLLSRDWAATPDEYSAIVRELLDLRALGVLEVRRGRQQALEILGKAIDQILPGFRASGDVVEHATKVAAELVKWYAPDDDQEDWVAENIRISALPEAERKAAIDAGLVVEGLTAEQIEDVHRSARTMPAFVKQCMEVNRLKAEVDKLQKALAAERESHRRLRNDCAGFLED